MQSRHENFCPLRLKFIHTPQALFFQILLCGVFILAVTVHAQQPRYTFKHLSVEHGLSHPSVHSILQDSQGFLWIGTEYGLNRYDGRSFKIYSHDPADSLSISSTSIYNIYEDRSKTLWIGTENGLNRFDRISESFIRYTPIPGDSTSISSGKIAAIYQSVRDTNSLWIATDIGLNKLDRNTGQFTRFLHDPNKKK